LPTAHLPFRFCLVVNIDNTTQKEEDMPATKTQSKKERKAFSTGSVAAMLVTGQKVGPLRDNNYKAVLGKDGKKVAQVADRASGAILENLPSEVEAHASKVLKESGKGGTGRYVVGDGDVDKARKLIQAAHTARVKQIEAKQAHKPKASGKRARAERRVGQARRGEGHLTPRPTDGQGRAGAERRPFCMKAAPLVAFRRLLVEVRQGERRLTATTIRACGAEEGLNPPETRNAPSAFFPPAP
jgi:hypothetical protein